MSDAFLDVLSSQCAELQRCLAQEYRSTLCRLEEQIQSLSAENSKIYKRLASSASVGSSGAKSHEGGTTAPDELQSSPSLHVPRSNSDRLSRTPSNNSLRGKANSMEEVDQPRSPSGRKLIRSQSKSRTRSLKADNLTDVADSVEEALLATAGVPGSGVLARGSLVSGGSGGSHADHSPAVSIITPEGEALEVANSPSGSQQQSAVQDSTSPSAETQASLMRPAPKRQVARINSTASIKHTPMSKVLPFETGKDEESDMLDARSYGSSESSIMFGVADPWQHMMTKRTRKNRRSTSGWMGAAMRSSGLRLSRTSGSSGITPSASLMSCRHSLLGLNVDSGEHWVLQALENFMLEPNSWLHLLWEALSFSLILYDLVTVPLEAFDPPETGFTVVMTWVVRIFWTLDIFVSFFTGYLDDAGRTVLHPKLVAKRYAMRQLHLDLLVVSTDWAEQVIGIRATGVFKSWRMLRILRLLRIKKAKQIMEILSEHIRSERLVVVASISKMLILLMTLCHLIGCCMYLLRRITDADPAESDWLAYDQALGARYMQSFHFAMGLFFGEHVVVLHSFTERFFTTFCMAMTFTLQIWFVSFITTAMTHLEIISTERSAKFSALSRFMADHSVPREVALKVERNAKHALAEQERNAPEESIALLKLISDPLMMELHFEIHMPTLRVYPFLRLYTEVDPAGTRKICHSAIALLSVAKHDVLFLAAESPFQAFHGPRVLFVVDGELEYMRQAFDKQLVTKDNWISEAVMWTNEWIHYGTLRAASETRLVALDVKKFQEFVTESLNGCACTYATSFVDMLNRLEPEELSDIGTFSNDMAETLQHTFPDDFPFIRAELETKYGVQRPTFATGKDDPISISSSPVPSA